ncbi:MAG: PEP-CTERM sorting domain-containing protein [Verrucomicrobiota bacterium]
MNSCKLISLRSLGFLSAASISSAQIMVDFDGIDQDSAPTAPWDWTIDVATLGITVVGGGTPDVVGDFTNSGSTGTFTLSLLGRGDTDNFYNFVDYNSADAGGIRRIVANNDGAGVNGSTNNAINSGQAILFEFDTGSLNSNGNTFVLTGIDIDGDSSGVLYSYGTGTTGTQVATYVDGILSTPVVINDGDRFAIGRLASSGSGGFRVDSFSLNLVPEPSSYAAIGGLCALVFALSRRRRAENR